MSKKRLRPTERIPASLRVHLTAGLIVALGAAAAPAQPACRPNALGAMTCTTPPLIRPAPRPPGHQVKRGLDKVIATPEPELTGRKLIPSREINSLGGKVLGQPAAGIRRCRQNQLGHLTCR